MKLTDEQIRKALDHRLSALNDPARPARIMNRIAQEEDPIYMKKKMTHALALTLVSALVFTTAALAATGNLFQLFGVTDARYAQVAQQAAISTTDAPGELPIRFESAYYDGLSLTATIVAENPPEVVAFTPNAEELAAMTVVSLGGDDMQVLNFIPAEVSAWEALYEATRDGTPYGYKVMTYDPVAYVTTEDGTEIPLAFGDEHWNEQGLWQALRESELPLPEELRNLPAITLRNEIMRVQWAWYFDGERLYRSAGAGESVGARESAGVGESAGFITATVPMAAGAQRHMEGTMRLNDIPVNASAEVSAMAAVLTLSAEGDLTVGDILRPSHQPPEGTDAGDIWVEVTAEDETGKTFRALEGLMPDQPLPVTIPFLGTAALPERMFVEIKLQWPGEGNEGQGYRLLLDYEHPSEQQLPREAPVRLSNSVYDGLSLSAEFMAASPPEINTFTPTDKELADMQAVDPGELAQWATSPAEAQAVQSLQVAMEQGIPYGYRVLSYIPGDRITDYNYQEIPSEIIENSWDEQGRFVQTRSFAAPLPEALRNLTAINIQYEIDRQDTRWYFDGEQLYAKGLGVREPSMSVTQKTPRIPGALREMTGSHLINGIAVTATAEVTATAAVITLTADGALTVGDLLPADQQPPEGTDARYLWVEVTALDEAWQLFRTLGSLSPNEPLPVTIPFLGTASLPEMMIVQIKLQWAGEGNDGLGFQLELAHEDSSTQPLRDGPPVRLSKFVYDGLSLRADLIAINPPVVTAFTPTDKELADMQVVDPGELAQWAASPAEAQAVQSLQAAMQQGIPYGYRVWRYLPKDRITDEAGLEIPIETIETNWDAQGRFVQTHSFALPLPEALRNLTAFTIRYGIERQDTRWYFDGERLYAEGLAVSQAHVTVQETTFRLPGVFKEMTGSDSIDDTAVTATAEVTAAAAVITLSADGALTVADLLPADQQPPAGTDVRYLWAEMTARDETGQPLQALDSQSISQPLPITVRFLGTDALPERLTLELKMQWEGEGNDGTGYVMGLE